MPSAYSAAGFVSTVSMVPVGNKVKGVEQAKRLPRVAQSRTAFQAVRDDIESREVMTEPAMQ
jgi:hypothetical protein